MTWPPIVDLPASVKNEKKKFILIITHNSIAGKGEIEGHAVNLEISLVGQIIYLMKTHAYYNATCNMGSFLHTDFS